MISKRSVVVVRWVARVLGMGLFLFWGAFFVEHLMEWFIAPFPQMPPPMVWLGQLIHFAMLAGFIVALKWQAAGSIMIIVGAFAFFIAASRSRFPLFFGVTIIPAILYLFCWWGARKRV